MAEIVIAIPTYRRPDALESALHAVSRQVDAANAKEAGDLSLSVLVIDNDPGRSGEQTARTAGVRYVSEPTPGIAAVRNRALRECANDRAVVFIDDDEVPEDDWLQALLEMYLSTGADAVAGRVITEFPPDVEPWVRASGAFVRPVRKDGQRMDEAATNNLLLDIQSVRARGLSFDERFGLTGGSDSMFTLTLTRLGGSIRWAENAVVREQEDPARMTKSWVLMRTFRFGNTSSRVRIALAAGRGARLRERARALSRGGARVVGGGGRWVVGAVTGSLPARARGLRTAYRGAGMIAGATGYAHDEYGRRRRAEGASEAETPS